MEIIRRLITPEYAKELLSKNIINRPIKDARVYRYANDMADGKWKEDTGELIKLDDQGSPIDGQHRLLAIIKSGKSINFHVAVDCDSEIQHVLDTGANRNGSDTLHLYGVKNAQNISSMLFKYVGLKDDTFRSRNKCYTPTNQVILDEYNKDPERFQECHAKSKHWYHKFASVIQQSVIASMFLHLSDKNEMLANQFMEELCTGLTLDPMILNLRGKFIANKTQQKKISTDDTIALIIICWNHYRKGQTRKFIKFDRNVTEYPKAI